MSKFIENENGLLQQQINSNFKTMLNAEPSSFIPAEEILAIDIDKDETIAEVFDDAAQDGEIDNILQIMSFHTKFLKDFLHFYNYLMYSQSVLAYDLRHYLAIIASSRHKCLYLITRHEKEFEQHNGQKEWLKGIENTPQKLRDLYEINKILAHQPWLLNHEHIAKTLGGQFSWSVTELIMAITILIHFHALSGFVFGCGINEKYMQLIDKDNEQTDNTVISKAIDVNLLINASNLPVLSEINFSSSTSSSKEIQINKNKEAIKIENTKENNPNLNNRNNNNKSSSSCINNNSTGNNYFQPTPTTSATSKTFFESTINNTIDDVNQYIQKYIFDPNFTHQDFRNVDQTLRLEYYTWERHGHILNDLFQDIFSLLDQTFKTAYNMTYNTTGALKNVDKSLFRRAVWVYIHYIFGIRYDDYDYNQIKKLLTKPLRNFIKIVCMHPERISKKDYDSITKEFSHSERVHINIVIMEARMQASMLYFFRAITQYYY